MPVPVPHASSGTAYWQYDKKTGKPLTDVGQIVLTLRVVDVSDPSIVRDDEEYMQSISFIANDQSDVDRGPSSGANTSRPNSQQIPRLENGDAAPVNSASSMMVQLLQQQGTPMPPVIDTENIQIVPEFYDVGGGPDINDEIDRLIEAGGFSKGYGRLTEGEFDIKEDVKFANNLLRNHNHREGVSETKDGRVSFSAVPWPGTPSGVSGVAEMHRVLRRMRAGSRGNLRTVVDGSSSDVSRYLSSSAGFDDVSLSSQGSAIGDIHGFYPPKSSRDGKCVLRALERPEAFKMLTMAGLWIQVSGQWYSRATVIPRYAE